MFLGENKRGKVPFCHILSRAWAENTKTRSLLTLVPALGGVLSVSPTVTSLFSRFPWFTLWQEVTLCGPRLSSKGLGCPVLGARHLSKLFGILLQGRPFSHLLIHWSFIYFGMDSSGYLFYTLGYNPIRLPLFCCSNYSSFGCREFFQLASVSL